jgi:hypothetical protein
MSVSLVEVILILRAVIFVSFFVAVFRFGLLIFKELDSFKYYSMFVFTWGCIFLNVVINLSRVCVIGGLNIPYLTFISNYLRFSSICW